ncbi:Ff.00g007770.m01.CDS01 [Fusarium sp. VM40]|nr:Ff.00g007770.m01.CDS01 [Fusarium sp. VM40]
MATNPTPPQTYGLGEHLSKRFSSGDSQLNASSNRLTFNPSDKTRNTIAARKSNEFSDTSIKNSPSKRSKWFGAKPKSSSTESNLFGAKPNSFAMKLNTLHVQGPASLSLQGTVRSRLRNSTNRLPSLHHHVKNPPRRSGVDNILPGQWRLTATMNSLLPRPGPAKLYRGTRSGSLQDQVLGLAELLEEDTLPPTTKQGPATTMDWSSLYPRAKTPPPTSTLGQGTDSIAQQVTDHADHLKWILNRYKVMDKTTAALKISNQETMEQLDAVLESTEELSARSNELIKGNESLALESKSLRASNAKLKTDLEKQESLHIKVKADFNKLLDTTIQRIKAQYDSQLEEVKVQPNAQLEEVKIQHDAQQSRSDEISVIRDQNRALTTLLGQLVMHLEVQDADSWQHTLQNYGCRGMSG